tara:strand:+ start:749 stop:949 length:201 start_codon:yes stop_codon:yes gene_type:complete
LTDLIEKLLNPPDLQQIMVTNNLMAGFGMVLGLEVVLTVSNVLSSYLMKNGQTLQEYLTAKVGAVA